MQKFKITEKGVNFLLIFILGFLVGVALKSEAQKRITIGFNDYLVGKYKQDINLMAPVPVPAASQGAASDQNAPQQNQPADSQGQAPQSPSNQ
ncbi:MAG: hypothetical protein NT093_04695 [Candidatus Moranbacteria bacterium]|nr:hypothetical protein [Candidatus Moranbacteria bacterium]